MADEKRTKVVLDLDNKEFVKKLRESLGLMGELGKSDSVQDLAQSFLKIGTVVGVATVAIMAMKAAIDLTKEAEHIQQVENSFEALASSAGLAATTIKEELVGAAKGLADDTQIMEAANKAIVTMGDKASALPQIMELARKATVTFGGDLVENFEKMSQALANGNTRMLRQYGLVVDNDKALKDYAKSLGVGVEYLSDSAKKQAIMNAALEQGEEKFKNVDESSLEATNNLKRIGVAFDQIKEVAIKAWDAMFGPTVKKGIEVVTVAFEYWAKKAQSIFSDESVDAAKKNAEAIEQNAKAAQKLRDAAKGGEEDKNIDYDKLRQDRLKFEADLNKINDERLATEIKFATDVETVNRGFFEREMQMRREAELQKEQLRREGLDKGLINQQQFAEASANIDTTLNEKIKQMNEEQKNFRIQALQNVQDRATTAADGIAAAFAKGSAQARQDLTNWGKTGQLVFDSVKNRAVQAFKAMGDGSKDAGQAMRGFILGAIADTAEAKGQEMLLAGIWPPNPAAIAGGGALIALAQVLKSQAEGSSKLNTGGGGAPGGAGAAGTTEAAKPEVQEQQKRKEVTVNIAGSFYETEQTRTRLMDMIREAGDFTDFTIRPIASG